MQNPQRRHSRVLNCAKYNKGYTMETHKQIIQNIKNRNSIQGDHSNIASRANSMTLTEEDIRILMFASKSIKEPCDCHDELQFDQNVFKRPDIYEVL